MRPFLDAGATVNFLLRSPTIFDNDEVIQKYVKAGKVRFLKGDGLVKADLERAWEEAGKEKPVDVLFFSVGKLVTESDDGNGLTFSSSQHRRNPKIRHVKRIPHQPCQSRHSMPPQHPLHNA